METITFNTISRAKRVVRNGKAVWIADATIIVPGVLNGSQGALYYPDEHVKKHVPDWNGIPLVVYHPIRNGQPVSGRDPDILDQWGVGRVWGSKWDGTKNVVKTHWDEDSVIRIDDRLRQQKGPLYNAMLPRLQQGLPIELSTGLYTDNVPATNGSNHKGRPYKFVAVNYRPDHLAILPDQKGACSIDDGCGINVNSEVIELVEYGGMTIRIDNANPEGINQYTGGGAGAASKEAVKQSAIKKVSEKADSASQKAEQVSAAAKNPAGHKLAERAHTDAASAHMDAANKHEDMERSNGAAAHMKAYENHMMAVSHHYKAGKSTTNAQPAGRYGNHKHTGTGKFLNFGAGLGHGEQHDAATDGYKGVRTCPDCGGKLNADDQCQACKEASKIQGTTNQLEIEDMDRRNTIGWLVANCDCWKGKEKILNGAVEGQPLFTDEELATLKTNVERSKRHTNIVNRVSKGVLVGNRKLVFNSAQNKFIAINEKDEKGHGCNEGDEDCEIAAVLAMKGDGSYTGNAPPPFIQAKIDAKNGEDEEELDEEGNPIPKKAAPPPMMNRTTRNKTMTMKDWEASMPPEAKAIWNTTKQAHDDLKLEIVGQLVANIGDDEERQQVGNELMQKHDLSGLKQLLKLIAPATQNRREERAPARQYNFVGAGGGYSGEITDNEDVELLDLPTMNWGNKQAS